MSEFDKLFDDACEKIKPIMYEIDISIFAKHNRGYDRYNTEGLLKAFRGEKERYRKTFQFLYKKRAQNPDLKVLDVGTLFPLLPLMYKEIGIKEVCCIEDFSFYGDSLNKLKTEIYNKYDIKMNDINVFEKDIPYGDETFDVVTFLAVIEHFSSTPAPLLKEINRVMKKNGCLVLDTPNAAAALKRVNFLLKGVTYAPPIRDFYYSEYPFTGHNREYTLSEIEKTLEWSNFTICQRDLFNLGNYSKSSLKVKLITNILPMLSEKMKDYIWVVATK